MGNKMPRTPAVEQAGADEIHRRPLGVPIGWKGPQGQQQRRGRDPGLNDE